MKLLLDEKNRAGCLIRGKELKLSLHISGELALKPCNNFFISNLIFRNIGFMRFKTIYKNNEKPPDKNKIFKTQHY